MRPHMASMLVFFSLLLSASSQASEAAAKQEDAIYQGKNLAEWIGDLKDPDLANRSAAARALAVFGPKKEVVSALAAALKDDNIAVVLFAAETLGKFGPKAKAALPALHTAFKRAERLIAEDQAYVRLPRQVVAEALVQIDDHPTSVFAPIFIAALRTDDVQKRRALASRMGKLDPDVAKTIVPVLVWVLKDRDEGVRLEAVKSLGRLGSAAKPAIHALTLALRNASPKKNDAVQTIRVSDRPVNLGDANIRTISFTVLTGDKAMLVACAEALGRIRPDAKGTVAALRLALRDLDEEVRWAALCALLESGRNAKELTPILLNFLRDKDAALRRVAVEALGKSGLEAKQLLPLLTAALKDENAAVRASAAATLGEKGTEAKQTAPALIGALKDPEASVRTAAAESLGKIGATDKEAVSALIAALGDKDEAVFRESGEALSKFGPRAKAAIPTLLPFLQDSKVNKRGMACLFLGAIGPVAKEAIPPLEKMSHSDTDEMIRLAAYTALAKIDSSRLKDTLGRLTTAYQSKKEDVCGAALECLYYLGADALPTLRTLRESTNDEKKIKDIDEVVKRIQNPEKDR